MIEQDQSPAMTRKIEPAKPDVPFHAGRNSLPSSSVAGAAAAASDGVSKSYRTATRTFEMYCKIHRTELKADAARMQLTKKHMKKTLESMVRIAGARKWKKVSAENRLVYRQMITEGPKVPDAKSELDGKFVNQHDEDSRVDVFHFDHIPLFAICAEFSKRRNAMRKVYEGLGVTLLQDKSRKPLEERFSQRQRWTDGSKRRRTV